MKLSAFVTLFIFGLHKVAEEPKKPEELPLERPSSLPTNFWLFFTGIGLGGVFGTFGVGAVAKKIQEVFFPVVKKKSK